MTRYRMSAVLCYSITILLPLLTKLATGSLLDDLKNITPQRYSEIVYDFVDSRLKPGVDVVLDLRGVGFDQIVTRLKANDKHLAHFGAIIVSDTDPMEMVKKPADAGQTVPKNAVGRISEITKAKTASGLIGLKIWIYFRAETVEAEGFVVADEMRKLMTEEFIQGFVFDAGLSVNKQNELSDHLRVLCNAEKLEEEKKGRTASYKNCPLIIHEYERNPTADDAIKKFQTEMVAKLVDTGKFVNPFFSEAVFNSVTGQVVDGESHNLSTLVNLHEGMTGKGQANWAHHIVVNGSDDDQYKNTQQHQIALAFTLAWPYGLTKMMGHTKTSGTWNLMLTILKEFRKTCGDRPVSNIYTNKADPNVLGFARASRGFFIASTKNTHTTGKIQTSLPAGTYCDIVNGGPLAQCHIDHKIQVDALGFATIKIPAQTVFLFSVDKRSGSKITLKEDAHPLGDTSKWETTEVLFERKTDPGEYLFIRGGYKTCPIGDKDAKCGVPILHETPTNFLHRAYNDWKVNDWYLDWDESEPNQGTHNGLPAKGTPMIWTTDDIKNPLYNEINAAKRAGPHNWYVKLKMRCTKGEEILVKGYAVAWFSEGNGFWENNIPQLSQKDGIDHVIICGELTRLKWNERETQPAQQTQPDQKTVAKGPNAPKTPGVKS